MASRLGELLVKEKLITNAQLQQALAEQKKKGGRLGSNLTKLGFIKENELTEFLSRQYGVSSINLNEFEIDANVFSLVPQEVALKHQVMPVNRAGSTLTLAMADPSNIFAIDDLKFITNYNIEVVVASEQSIRDAIDIYYGTGKKVSESSTEQPKTKLCPYCAEEIKFAAIKCKHCGSMLNDKQKTHPDDLAIERF